MRSRLTLTSMLVVSLFVMPADAQEEPPQPVSPQILTTPTPHVPSDLRQVQLHVWISETGEQGLRDLGANLTYTRFVRGRERSGNIQQINTRVHSSFDQAFAVTLPAPDSSLFGQPMRPDQNLNISDGIQTQSGVGLTFDIIQEDHGTISGVFRAIERKSDVDLISKPELLVINNREAKIHAGGEVPFQSIRYHQNEPYLQVEWKPIGAKLTLTPTIYNDELIDINITEMQIEDVARYDNVRGIDLPVFSSRKQTGLVRVPNRRTLVIGGLSSTLVRVTEQRVPWLGSFPILGALFRGRRAEATTNTLLIFVSPTIVDLRRLDQAAVDALEFWRKERWLHEEEITRERDILEMPIRGRLSN